MHGETLKFVNAQQAKPYNFYKNTKLKLLKTNASIWFNKICRDRQLKPRYINIKIKGRKQQGKSAFVVYQLLNPDKYLTNRGRQF